MSAEAVTYDFPDNLPSTCAPVFFSTNEQDFSQYVCNGLMLNASDSITINATRPNATESVTITSDGAMAIGASAKINETGSADKLTFKLAGALALDVAAILNANVVSTSTVAMATDGRIGGGIVTTTTGAAVTTAARSTVGGAISTDDSAIVIGVNNAVHGSITTGLGAISIGADSQVEGDINGGKGAVFIGSHVTWGLKSGNITTVEGEVTIDTYTETGFIHTGGGDIIVGNHSQINGALTTVTGGVVINEVVVVSGDVIIFGGLGDIYIGRLSEVCGNVRNDGLGNIIMVAAQVAGSLYTRDGAITTAAAGDARSSVGSNAYIDGNGVMTMTDTLVGGDITSHSGTMTLTDTLVRGLATRVGGDITMTRSSDKQVDLQIPGPQSCPADPVIGVAGSIATGSTATGLFDCMEAGSRLALNTKLAGTDFSFDIVALNSDKTLASNYVLPGEPNKYTKVELFNDPDINIPNSSQVCETYGTTYGQAVAAQIVAFNAGLGGHALTGSFNLPQVYKKLRCRVTECMDSTCTTVAATVIPSCSSDEFAVRPVAVTLSSTEANAIAPLVTSMPVIKAGANFNLSAVTTITTITDNYLGTLTLDTGKLTAQNPAQATTQESGGVVGTLTPTLTANAPISAATYSEVGYLYLAAGAYRDDDFTQVDSINGKGDCIADSLSDSLSGGQYGCSIGNAAAVKLGRFTPDHFGVSGSGVTRSDLQTVESQTLPFTYMNEPMQLAITVTAYNNSEGVTQNYRGVFASLNTSNWSLADWTCTNQSQTQCMGLSASDGATLLTNRLAIDTGSLHSAAPQNTSWSIGSSDFTSNITLQRSTSPDGPYEALKLGAKPQDLDGVTLPLNAATDISHCVNLNTATGVEVQNCTFASANQTDLRRTLFTTRFRFGRLNIVNASGSELLALPVPVEAQYWNGSSFAINADDNLTALADTSIVSVNYQGVTRPTFRVADPTTGSCSAGSLSTGVISAGKSCILFGKPLVSGGFDALISLGSEGSPANCLIPTPASGTGALGYLSGNWCGTAYDRDPSARVTFGIYGRKNKNNTALIYFREVY